MYLNGHDAMGLIARPKVRPETGPQPHDGVLKGSTNTGRAQLLKGQGKQREDESPLVKFQRVWAKS